MKQLIPICQLLIICSLLLPTSSAIAQTAPSGLTITPPLQQIELQADQSEYRSTMIITNNQDQPAELTMSALDFGDMEQGGGLAFLGTTPDQVWDRHRLAPWMTITPNTATIPPHSQQAFEVAILNDQTLSPGGHYAAVIATLNTATLDIAVKPSLSSLLFVNKVGGAVYDVEVKDLSPQAAWWGSVDGVKLQLTNKGNTHVTPRGQLQLKDPTGAVIAQTVINQQSGLLLPQQIQNYQAKLTPLAPAWWPGNYTLVLSYRYDGSDQYITQQTTIFSVGIATIAGLSLAVCAGIAWASTHYIKRRKTEL